MSAPLSTPPFPPKQQGIMGVKLDLSLDQNDFAPFTGSGRGSRGVGGTVHEGVCGRAP